MLTNFLFSFSPLESYPHYLCFLVISEFLLLNLWLRKHLRNISINSIHWGSAKYFSYILRFKTGRSRKYTHGDKCLFGQIWVISCEVLWINEYQQAPVHSIQTKNLAPWVFFTVFCVLFVPLVTTIRCQDH